MSRSKCADIITACVPVSWAIAIIISETVDATDYYDGFGTGQIVIGIRAYQWGWEYFYPKAIDLSYNLKPSYSSIVGNSLKYSTYPSDSLVSNSFWKAYQIKTSQSLSSSPAHLLLSPSDNSKLTNGVSFNNIGLSSIKDSTAFKKIQYFSKISTGDINSSTLNFSNKFNNVNNLYLNSYKFNDAYSYGTFRQHNYTSLGANLSSNGSLLDLKGSDKFIQFNLNSNPNSNTQNVLTPLIKSSTHNNVNSSSHFKSTLINTSKNLFLNSFYKNNKISNSVLFYPNYKDHVSNSYLNFFSDHYNGLGYHKRR